MPHERLQSMGDTCRRTPERPLCSPVAGRKPPGRPLTRRKRPETIKRVHHSFLLSEPGGSSPGRRAHFL